MQEVVVWVLKLLLEKIPLRKKSHLIEILRCKDVIIKKKLEDSFHSLFYLLSYFFLPYYFSDNKEVYFFLFYFFFYFFSNILTALFGYANILHIFSGGISLYVM
jgi:hypothetical protein